MFEHLKKQQQSNLLVGMSNSSSKTVGGVPILKSERDSYAGATCW